MVHLISAAGIIFVTIIVFNFANWLYKRYAHPLLLPVAVSTFILIFLLYIFNMSYETYMIGGEWINQLLGPAVVSLAYPLYIQRQILKKLAIPLLLGSLIGAIAGVSSGILLVKWAGFEDEIIVSLTPKSVTTPVAMDIAHAAGGITTLAAVFVMIAGIGGTMLSAYIFRLFRIESKIGRGVGLGSASHAIGTAKAMESSELEGSISTITMIVSAVYVSIIAPLFFVLFRLYII
ncbi:LrgB family protein [Virgibacillus sp. W0430]|uniref:LrgB family protein n=1 Tax=Virgibacillus sp. W0430 TaxID=3391580 RepID=UPI003F4465E4